MADLLLTKRVEASSQGFEMSENEEEAIEAKEFAVKTQEKVKSLQTEMLEIGQPPLPEPEEHTVGVWFSSTVEIGWRLRSSLVRLSLPVIRARSSETSLLFGSCLRQSSSSLSDWSTATP
ncbi:hypothetical protein V1527DRAFT_492974 [Lipomyces starkeyi]